jgi:16S rRNA (adenine1518-N6/adenine1519-N6)-dimethyltransferase
MGQGESPRQMLRRLGLRPRKALGQHFLVSRQLAERIVQAALDEKPDGIVEIGPGLGIMTAQLAASGLPVVAIEKDQAMQAPLREIQARHPDLELRYEDVLEADLAELTSGGAWVAIGNLPYQITSPLLEKLLTTTPPFKAIVVTVQKEVGERLCAQPGTKQYGGLTLLVQLYAEEPSVVCSLGPPAFYPAPKVDSVAVKMLPRPEPPLAEEKRRGFFALVRAAFGQRRKKLRNALTLSAELGLTAGQAQEALRRAHIEPGRRGETLSLEEFLALAEAVRQARG